MQEVKETTLGSVLCDHEIVVVLVKTYAHIENYVRMPHLIDNLYFFNEICYTLLSSAPFLKPFDSYSGAHPLGFEDSTIAASAKVIQF